MIGEESHANRLRGGARRVFDGMFGPVLPRPGSGQDIDERIEFVADIMSRQWQTRCDSGFSEIDADTRLDIARRVAWMRWRAETDRLDDGWHYPIAVQTTPRQVAL